MEQSGPLQASTLPISMKHTESIGLKKKKVPLMKYYTLLDSTSHCLIGLILNFFEVIPALKLSPKFEKISTPPVSGHNPGSKTVHHLVIIIFKH